MFLLLHKFRLEPATPAARDAFVEVQRSLLDAQGPEDGQLIGAWFTNAEWYSEIVHLTRFADMNAFMHATARRDAAGAPVGQAAHALNQLAPTQSSELLADLGPVASEKLDAAIEASSEKPAGVYTFALLDVPLPKRAAFSDLFAAVGEGLPIIGCWSSLIGDHNTIIDLWSGDTERFGFQPTSPALDAFFTPLREIAPRERVQRMHPLPYSPLQ